MREDIDTLLGKIVAVLKDWDNVVCITLTGLSDLDPFDPYFYLAIDCYYQERIPYEDERRRFFPEAAAFESSPAKKKDRFLLNDLPVRIDYKEINYITQLIDHITNPPYILKEKNTYVLYRLEKAKVLYNKMDWLDRIRERIHSIPPEFWISRRRYHINRMENALNDLGAAVLKEDEFFTQLSLSRFMINVMGSLFSINRIFEPSMRLFKSSVETLETIPDGFNGRLATLLREDPELDPERKREVAELLAKSIISL